MWPVGQRGFYSKVQGRSNENAGWGWQPRSLQGLFSRGTDAQRNCVLWDLWSWLGGKGAEMETGQGPWVLLSIHSGCGDPYLLHLLSALEGDPSLLTFLFEFQTGAVLGQGSA